MAMSTPVKNSQFSQISMQGFRRGYLTWAYCSEILITNGTHKMLRKNKKELIEK